VSVKDIATSVFCILLFFSHDVDRINHWVYHCLSCKNTVPAGVLKDVSVSNSPGPPNAKRSDTSSSSLCVGQHTPCLKRTFLLSTATPRMKQTHNLPSLRSLQNKISLSNSFSLIFVL
jgi:hypothetical protein